MYELSRRERQIMEILHKRGQATAAEVLDDLPNPPSYSAARALLRILEEKGHITHVQQGPRFLFTPSVSPKKARSQALKQFMATFCNGSPAEMVAALIDSEAPDRKQLEALSAIIEQAKKEGR